MSNCNPFKISLKSLYSYDDLTDLPSINGVEVKGNLSLEDLGLDTWLSENTKFIVNSSSGEVNQHGFTIEDSYAPNIATFSASQVSLDYTDDISNSHSRVDISSGGFSVTASSSGFAGTIYIDPYSGISFQSGYESATLDASTLNALIALL